MERSILFLFALLFRSANADAATCESGWTAYKNEICVQLYPNKLTFTEAVNFCTSKGNSAPETSLVMMKTPDIQNLLTNYTHGLSDSIWIGGKYFSDSAKFKWLDGEALEYTNWLSGYPANSAEGKCIEFTPDQGKWVEITCQKRNLVICQKPATRSLSDTTGQVKRMRIGDGEDIENIIQKFLTANGAIDNLKQTLQQTNSQLSSTRVELNTAKKSLEIAITEMQQFRKQYKEDLNTLIIQLNDATEEINKLKGNQETTTRSLETVTQNPQSISSSVVPLGYIYIEYYNQPGPTLLWPSLTWQDITSGYAGLFFRAYGGGSAGWGLRQPECSPRITQMQSTFSESQRYPNPINIPASGWSPYGDSGDSYNHGNQYWQALRFYTESCEIRPVNQAIKIWKRIG